MHVGDKSTRDFSDTNSMPSINNLTISSTRKEVGRSVLHLPFHNMIVGDGDWLIEDKLGLWYFYYCLIDIYQGTKGSAGHQKHMSIS